MDPDYTYDSLGRTTALPHYRTARHHPRLLRERPRAAADGRHPAPDLDPSTPTSASVAGPPRPTSPAPGPRRPPRPTTTTPTTPAGSTKTPVATSSATSTVPRATSPLSALPPVARSWNLPTSTATSPSNSPSTPRSPRPSWTPTSTATPVPGSSPHAMPDSEPRPVPQRLPPVSPSWEPASTPHHRPIPVRGPRPRWQRQRLRLLRRRSHQLLRHQWSMAALAPLLASCTPPGHPLHEAPSHFPPLEIFKGWGYEGWAILVLMTRA